LKNIFAYDAKHKFAAVAAVTMIKAYYRLRRWNRVEEWARKLISKGNFKYKSRDDLETYIAIAIHEHSMDLSRARKHSEAITESMRLVKEFRKKNKELAAKSLMNVGVLYERARDVKLAVKTYERVLKEFKGTTVAPEAQYTIGMIYESQTRFKEASAAFLKMSKFKKHPKAPDAIANAGLIREAMRDYSGAIKAFNQYEKLFPKNDDVPDVNFKIGLLYERIGGAKSLAKAVKHYQSFAKKYSDRYVMKVEAYSRAGDILRRLDVAKTHSKRNLNKEGKPKRMIFKNRRKAIVLFENALAEFPKAVQLIATMKGGEKIGKAVTARRFVAQSSYWLADYVFQDFDAVKIPGTLRVKILKTALIDKANLHQEAEQAFDKVLPLRDAGWIACAAFRNGLLYYNFAKELFEVPIPFGLSPEQEDEYRAALEEIGAPVQEKSLVLLRAALKAAHDKGVYNTCAKDAGIFASKVSPEDFPITGDDQLIPDKTKDTLLSANFIRTLKRGVTVVDMLKPTSKDAGAPEGK
ncbi:MAG: TolA-binding protein, partial [Myxococcota bacterium]